jgi:hypothetical protein
MRLPTFLVSLLLLAPLAGCDLLGIESPAAVAAKREAEGKAVGGACRHAGRAIEDCYTLNRKADKGAMFAGWREMNDYMRENKIDVVAPSCRRPVRRRRRPRPPRRPTTRPSRPPSRRRRPPPRPRRTDAREPGRRRGAPSRQAAVRRRRWPERRAARHSHGHHLTGSRCDAFTHHPMSLRRRHLLLAGAPGPVRPR